MVPPDKPRATNSNFEKHMHEMSTKKTFEVVVEEYFKTKVPKGQIQRIDGIECFSPLPGFWFWRQRLNRMVKRGILVRKETRSYWKSCDGMPGYGWHWD
jgi:hypothetical protein